MIVCDVSQRSVGIRGIRVREEVNNVVFFGSKSETNALH